MRFLNLAVFPILVLFLITCGGKFVKKEDIQRISKDYDGVYVLRTNVETGNFESLSKGARVRLYFKAAGDYVAVYAYPHMQPREEAEGKNILQLFEGDFPDKKFSAEFLRQRLDELVEEYKGKSENPKPVKSAKKAGKQ